jgi:hypothetical protein
MTHASRGPRRALGIAPVLAALTGAIGACGDDPFSFRWSDVPDTAQIYSLARPELNVASGFSFLDGASLVIERPAVTGLWDAVLDTQGGELVLLPPGALGVSSRARIAALPGIAFGDVTEAPGDTLVYVANDPVPVVAGTTYVIRTNVRPCSFGSAGTYYAKMEPITIDAVGGTLTFRYVTNPICNSRDLVPPE